MPMWSNSFGIVVLVLLFALSVLNIILGIVKEGFRTSAGKRGIGVGMVFLAVSITFSIYNGFVRSSLLVSEIALLVFVSGFIVVGVGWYQTTLG